MDADEQYLVNLRLELQQVFEILRHVDRIMLSIAAFLVPFTTAGFALKIDKNECFVLFAGVISILTWLVFIFISIIFIKKEIEPMFNYGIQLCGKLDKKISSREKRKCMGLLEMLKPRKRLKRINYLDFLYLLGAFICIGWVIYLCEKRLVCFCYH